MKKLAHVFMAVLMTAVLLAQPLTAQASNSLTASAAILIDANTGEILYKKGATKRVYPASITKVLTAMVVLEQCDVDETLTASSTAVKLPRGYSHVGMKAGEQMKVNDALYAMMLPSANDAANALAEHAGGSQAQFAKMMNRRAKEIGATDTNFTNASGMPDKNHYTTARDMALITREAIKNKNFRKYFSATSYTLPATNKRSSTLKITGYQYMLQKDQDVYYPAAVGGKMGYTDQAKHTMVTVAQSNGRTLICVVFGCTKDGKYADTRRLLNYGFSKK